MKTRNLLCVSVVCLLASSAWAGDKNMAMERRVKVERAISAQEDLPDGVEPNAPKMDSEVPKKNSKYFGHQSEFTGIQTGGQQQDTQRSQRSQAQDLPQGGQGWRKRIAQDNNKKGSVADLSRDAQMIKLADPTGGLQDH